MLPAEQRLRANQDFRRVYGRGRSFVSDLVVLYVLRRADAAGVPGGCRVGFVVSKKQGGAVVRNRIKRRLREAVRRHGDLLPARPCDLVFVGRGRLKSADWPAVQAVVADLLRRAGSGRSK
jgi:ribonuclease P protein component